MLSYIEGKQFEYPIYFDLEEKSNPQLHTLSKEHLTELCVTFVEILQEHGYYCGIYVNNDWLYNILDTDEIKARFDIWFARYPYISNIMWSNSDIEWNIDSYGKQLGMWQYTEKGYFEENGKKFDFNYCYKDYPEIMSVEETSAALGVSTKTVYKMLKNGTIQNMKVGRSYRVPKVHLLSFLKINMAKA
jgi:excisionase family DNA binding protein